MTFYRCKGHKHEDHAKPCIREDNPDHIILLVAERVGKSIVDLAKSLLFESRKVTISGIIQRNNQWNNKAEQVNNHLKEMCSSVNMVYNDHFKNFNPPPPPPPSKKKLTTANCI